ncbi:MAG TPA: hypothetical protein VF280_15365 [Burkholderiales bacterium]|jgi:hypothetical protein
MTLATDYLLAAVTGWLAVLLYRRSFHRAVRWWAYAFMALAAGAFLGGTWHGFLQNDLLWKATVLSVGVASFAMVAGSSFAALGGRARDAVLWLAGLKLIAYWWWMLGRDDFIYVVIDTGIAFGAVAAMHLWRFNGWILAGVAVSVAAAAVQASGFAPHPSFNHNDLYHVIQLAAMLLLYRGARTLNDRA